MQHVPHPTRHASGPLRRVAPLLLVLLAACQGDEILPGQTEAKDRETRLEYYETSALTYYDGGNYPRAEIMAERWLAESPGNQKARRVLARSKLEQGTPGKLREAEAILVELVELTWSHPTRGDIGWEVRGDLAQTYTNLADLYDRDLRELDAQLRAGGSAGGSRLQEDFETQRRRRDELLAKAMPMWESVLAANKDNPFALSALAKGHLQMGQDEIGIHYAMRYLELARTSQEGWKTQMEEYEARLRKEGVPMHDSQRAEFVRRALGAREREKGIHLLLGSVFMRRQEYARAVEAFTNVIRIDASVPAAYVERAQAFAALGRFDKAVEDLEAYLRITDPQHHRDERLLAVERLERWRAALRR